MSPDEDFSRDDFSANGMRRKPRDPAPSREPGGFFRGSELPRLIFLLAVLAGGWFLAVTVVRREQAKPALPAPARPPQAGDRPPPPPDDAIELQGVVDRAPLTPRENPGYLMLLQRVRDTPAAELLADSRRDVVFSQLIENPRRYRGLPIHLEGTVLRVLRQDATGSKLFPKGEFFEAYAITPDSQNFPYILIFEDAPANLPVGDDLRVHAAFDGYFFKLLSYQAGDTMRFAPALVGRIRWLDLPAREAPAAKSWQEYRWVFIGLALLGGYMIVRWTLFLRRAFSPTRRTLPSKRLVRDEIEPEALEEWLSGSPPADDGPEGPSETGRRFD